MLRTITYLSDDTIYTRMKELDHIIKETVDEVLQQIAEYGPNWNSRLDGALTELESLMKSYNDPPFAELLLQVKDIHGLSEFETFMVGENSTYPTSDEFWKSMGPSYSKFIGGYDDSIYEDLPLSGDKKYIQQQQTDTAPMPANVAPATWREGSGEKVETKVLSAKSIAYFHNHGCIVSNNSSTPLKVVCTEMTVNNQRAYYTRLDEA